MTTQKPLPILLVAGAAGACTMAVELAAVRLLAPWFGTSARVWTNVIGVILLALALGYLIGARWAAGPRPERALSWTLMVSAVWTAWLPAAAAPLCRWFMPAGVALDSAADLFTWGSLAATLCLFLPPAVLLGCVGPLSVEAVQRRDASSAGSAGGRVLGVSTLGSLVGTFATTHGLVPWLGISWTLLAVGAVLFVVGVALAWSVRARAAALVALVLIAPAVPWSRLHRDAPPDGVEVLASRESPYQSIRVVEDRRWEPTLRLLQVNEGLDSYQSVWRAEPGLLGPGYYYDLFALPAWWSRADGPFKVLILGLGAGTTERVLRGASPPGVQLQIVGVELDSVVVELAERWFELERSRPDYQVIVERDARAVLRGAARDFDLIVLDAYAHQVEIPFHLATREAFAEMRAHLAPGGWLAVNVGGFGFDDPVVTAVGATVAASFSTAVAYRVPRSRNFVLFARRDGSLPLPAEDAFSFEGVVADALLPALRLPSARRVFTAGGTRAVLTDDRSPIDQLQMRSLEEGRERLVSSH